MVGSIREVHRALRDSGYMISENWIRDRIRAGEIPALKIGTRALVSYEVIRDYIEKQLRGA